VGIGVGDSNEASRSDEGTVDGDAWGVLGKVSVV